MEKEKTGYPHIDRPWSKWYEGLSYNYANFNTNLADYIKNKNIGREGLIAQTYYGNTFTYGELFQRFDDASKVLSGLDVSKGDVIFNLVPNIPESGQIWLGASQIGAISDFADPRPDSMDVKANSNKILELLRYEKADYIVALDKCYTYMLKPIENEIKELGINNIIIVSANDSMNIRGMIDYLIDVINYNKFRNNRITEEAVKKLKFYQALYAKIQSLSVDRKKFEESVKNSPIEIFRYKDLVKEFENEHFTEIKDGDLVSYIGHTSGTSGARPKPIPLTNKNQISATEQAFKADAAVDVGDKVIHELPFFSPLGADNNYIIDLASGANLIDVPEFEINEFGYLIKKYKPNVFLGTPSWLSSLTKCEYLKKENLKCIKRAIYGGDLMSIPDEISLKQWLVEHGSKGTVEKGHGMSEFCGGATYAQKEWNELGSMGIPFPDTIYGIVDPNIEDRLVPIKNKDKDGFICGELVVSSDAVTSGMLFDNEIVKHYNMDGKSYIRTRDLVKMREDGIFFFEARKDRSFTRFDGYKVKPAEIEKEIENSPYVKKCILVNYYDEGKKGNMPIAHLVLNDDVKVYSMEDYEKIVKTIVYDQIINNKNMSSRQIPSKFKFRMSIPLTKNGKYNYNALIFEGLDGTEVSVDIEETNLSVGKISIYSNKNVKSLEKNIS